MKPYYQDDYATIYHGDCREILPTLPKVDLVLTDPPYGIGASSGVGKYGLMKWGGKKDKGWDNYTPSDFEICQIIGSANLSIIWGLNYFRLPPSRNYFVWDKGEGFKDRTFAECELAWCSWDANAKVYKRDPLACGDYKGKFHPTQKPLSLMLWCIQQAPSTVKTIVDPYGGAMTTARAAKDLGLHCITIEGEEEYCEQGAKRLEQECLPLTVDTKPEIVQTSLI